MGWGDLGVFYQNSRNFAVDRTSPAFVTPNLDTLAAEGMQLRRHYCPAPVCAPSRASLLLGVHQGHSNIRDNQFDKALENNHTLGTVLKEAGYATAMIGKYGLHGSGSPAEAHPQFRGFDYFFGYLEHLDAHYHYPKESAQNLYDEFTQVTAQLDKCYSTDLWTARAKQWIVDHRTAQPEQPFFLYLAFTAPHARLEVPTQAYPAGAGTNGGVQWLGTAGNMINTASGTVDSWIHPDYAGATYDHDNNPGTTEVNWPDYAKRHATMIRRIDDAVADLVQTLKDLNVDTNTLVVFTSDNGPHNESGAGGSYTYNPTFFDSFGPMDGIKRDTWEAGMREPTLVRWAGHIPAGTTNFTASQFHDWMPTFADAAGLPAPARTDGVSLLPTLLGNDLRRPSLVYVEYQYGGSTPNYAEFEPSHRGATRNQEQVIHLEGYKGIRYNVTDSSDNFRIYDTLTDPKETTDLAGTSGYFHTLQARMKDRVLQVRRPGGGVTRPYDSTLVPPVTVTSLTPGLDYAVYEAAFPWVPDFAPLTPATNGVCSGLDLSVRTRPDDIGLLYTGYLNVPTDGTYTLYLTADSRAFLRLHEASLIDADFGYVGGTERSASIGLKAGRHPLRLGYVRSTGASASLTVQWSGPGIPKQPIPAESLLRVDPGVTTGPTAVNDSASTARGVPVSVDVLANDLPGSGPGPLRILSLTSPAGGSAVTNLAGDILYTPNAGFLGEDQFTYTMTDGLSNATASVMLKVVYTDGLIWFPLNQTSGLTTESAGGAHEANLTGFNNDPGQWVAGKWNRAIAFNGSANYASIAGFNGILGTGDRSCAAWVKTTSSGQLPVIAWGPNVAGNKWTFLIQNGNARLEVTGGYRQGTTLVNDGQWHHVACTFANDGTPNATDVQLYVDGALETSFNANQPQAINTTSSGEVKIASDVQGRFFLGTLDEPRIYDRALTPGEVAALYAADNQSATAWHRRYYGGAPEDWNGGDSLGLPRLLDYAFGGQPWIANADLFIVHAQVAGDRLQMRFNRRIAGTSELIYSPQGSRDLSDWNTLTASLAETLPQPELPGFEQAIFQTDATLGEEAAQFFRVQVTLP
jgi:arylsulfatase A-like enzyme